MRSRVRSSVEAFKDSKLNYTICSRKHILHLKGCKPDVVLDLGAYKGEWTSTMQQHVFKNSIYHLFEPNKHPELANVLLSDGPGEVDWYCKGTTGDSIFKEKTFHFDDCKVEKRSTVDLDNAKNVFMKIDC